MGQNLRVAGGAEHDTAVAAELGPDLGGVVDLAVVADDGAAAWIGHRLPAGVGQILNGQAPMNQADRPLVPDAESVGAAMGQHAPHRPQGLDIDVASAEIEQAGDSAHT